MRMQFWEILLGIVLIVAVALGVHFLAKNGAPASEPADTQAAALENLPVEPPPPMTEHMKEVLAASKGFSMFISYTDDGFQPADVTIKRGDTVRFTNNSSHEMWIAAAAADGKVYPASAESCGRSAFDTCEAFPPHEIWEFTFEAAGDWQYQNNADKSKTGVIRVR